MDGKKARQRPDQEEAQPGDLASSVEIVLTRSVLQGGWMLAQIRSITQFLWFPGRTSAQRPVTSQARVPSCHLNLGSHAGPRQGLRGMCGPHKGLWLGTTYRQTVGTVPQ